MAENRPMAARAAALSPPREPLAELMEPGTMGQIMGAEINQQIATARAYPRSIQSFHSVGAGLVTMSTAVAEECFYTLERRKSGGGTSNIEGPSARFAEIIENVYGNCRAGARIIAEDKSSIIAQGFFHDLERNSAVTIEVRRRITDSKGNRYSDDMVNVTAQAALAIAHRNAVLKGIPKAIWWPVYVEARRCAIGNAETLAKRRADLIDYFGKMRVKPDQIFRYLEVKGVEDITGEHLMTLRGIANAIKDGEQSIDDVFPPVAMAKAGTAPAAAPAAQAVAEETQAATQVAEPAPAAPEPPQEAAPEYGPAGEEPPPFEPDDVAPPAETTAAKKTTKKASPEPAPPTEPPAEAGDFNW